MAKGISIHLGLNCVDHTHYGSSHMVPNCVNDAMVMQAIADRNGFDSYSLFNQEANSRRFMYLLNEAADLLEQEDILFISFAGHGSFFQDLNGDEEDGLDEALVLYDRVVIDDELYWVWSQFKPGVRILFVCDACHSGTITQSMKKSMFSRWFGREHTIDEDAMNAVYQRHQRLYDAKLKSIPSKLQTSIECTVLLLSACQDKETADAGVGAESGLSPYTELVVNCWSDGRFEGSYKNFYNEIRQEAERRNLNQRPNYVVVGKSHPSFEQQIPFSI